MSQKTVLRHAQNPAVRGTSSPSTFRRDIQGLRALAVLAVFADHLFKWPTGGFAGVDVFFVISGFIITSLLLRQHEKNGSISFADFYRRRVKRILPVSTLVLVVTVAASYLLFRAGRAGTILTDAAWSLFFAGNWRFGLTGTDYWAADGTLSPLQHYWSLGVEEQFYFVWPLLIVATLAMTIRSRFLVSVLLVLVVASFLWAMWETTSNPAWAYFSTFSRAWELGIGALLAVGSGVLHKIPSILRPVLAWLGLAGIGASFFILSSESQIPAPGVALPVLATALVIAAGTGGDQRFIAPLTNRVSGYLGDISYSLYLWHFPLIVLLAALFPEQDLTYFVGVLVAAFLLSVLSFHFVENPIRKSSWLDPHARRSSTGKRMKLSSKLQYIGLAVLAAATAVVVTIALIPPAPVTATAPKTLAAPSANSAAPESVTNGSKLAGLIRTALKATAWPELSPSLDDVTTAGRPVEDEQGCSATIVSDSGSCNFSPGGTKKAIVLGDSTGITLLPTVRAALGDTYNVRGLTRAGCLILDLDLKADPGGPTPDDCTQHAEEAVEEVNRVRPSVVFISNTPEAVGKLASGISEGDAGREWQSGLESLITRLAPSGAKIIVVSTPPVGKLLSECATRTSEPSDCAYSVANSYWVTATATKSAVAAKKAHYIDTLPWFCDGDTCPSFVGKTPVKRDKIHTTKQYAGIIAPAFKDQLKKIGGLV